MSKEKAKRTKSQTPEKVRGVAAAATYDTPHVQIYALFSCLLAY
jgi:hypothetical protein